MMVLSPQVTWGPFLNRMSGRICRCGCSCSQSHTWCDLLPRCGSLFKSDRDRNYHGAVPVCATAVILEILYICTWASVNCCQNIDLSMLLFMLCIHACKRTYRHESFVYICICCAVWNTVRCMLACSSFWPPLAATASNQDSVQAGTWYTTSRQPVVSNIFCSKWPVEHAPEVRAVHHGAFGITA